MKNNSSTTSWAIPVPVANHDRGTVRDQLDVEQNSSARCSAVVNVNKCLIFRGFWLPKDFASAYILCNSRKTVKLAADDKYYANMGTFG